MPSVPPEEMRARPCPRQITCQEWLSLLRLVIRSLRRGVRSRDHPTTSGRGHSGSVGSSVHLEGSAARRAACRTWSRTCRRPSAWSRSEGRMSSLRCPRHWSSVPRLRTRLDRVGGPRTTRWGGSAPGPGPKFPSSSSCPLPPAGPSVARKPAAPLVALEICSARDSDGSLRNS